MKEVAEAILLTHEMDFSMKNGDDATAAGE